MAAPDGFGSVQLPLRPFVLAALLPGEDYGRGVIQRLEDSLGGALKFRSAAVYPILRQLEAESLVSSRLMMPPGVPRSKPRYYYKLTDSGLKAAESAAEELLELFRRKVH